MMSNIMNNFRREVNKLTAAGEPFMFMVDFDLREPRIYPLNNLPEDIQFCTPLLSRTKERKIQRRQASLKCDPVDFDTYSRAYNNVINNIKHGNSYLLNLTFPTGVEIDMDLADIFLFSDAKYKLLYRDNFVVFSPETFIEIDNGTIRSFPMKGTIDASEQHALEKIMNDEKELSEHNTIVDLIRNDLSIVAKEVEVPRYRYHEIIRAGDKDLIQISSEVSGKLGNDWRERLGDIIVSLLPAGSISGAPKKETIRIIKESEVDSRGYYTGVFGVFDGERLDSAVMIRFIEQIDGKYVYRSGGGITYLSDLRKEFDELIAKVYVPFG